MKPHRQVAAECGAWARACGVLRRVRTRWMPDGSQAAIAELWVPRPPLGPARSQTPDEQPLPLRALGEVAASLPGLEGRTVDVQGVLRRRFFRRDEAPYWGQVELWVERIAPIDHQSKE